MDIPLVDLRGQHEELGEEMARALRYVLDRQDFILGREVTELESRLASLCGRRHAVACASGSDALLLAMMALGIGPGDEVIVPAFTFFATASCVTRVGARPIFADIDPATFNIDPAKLTMKARAIIPVDLFGQVADMERLAPAAGLMVEDAAQSILAARNGKPAGSFGAVSTLSFYPTKNLSAAGDAGMLLTDDDEIAARARRLRAHGADKTYFHQEVGIVSRMATFQAAILLVKLERLASWTEQKIAAAAIYDRLFAGSGVTTPVVAAGNRHVYHQYTIRVSGDKRDALRDHLRAAGIGSAVYYPLPLHLQPCFADLFAEMGGRPGDLPESERASREVLSLPIYPRITPEQQERVVESVVRFLA
jgi:dTDP-4-amino-4,6-dideoxygalactose transaminase